MKNLNLSSSGFGGFASSRTKLAAFLAIALVAVTMFLGCSIHPRPGWGIRFGNRRLLAGNYYDPRWSTSVSTRSHIRFRRFAGGHG